ncbi:hypothetical protein [Microtetraspora sp. NBRC 16547]|uniref:hypothetical protein n=1 Tax=Microtetraspora sp. NBRC 16547 TaxID=3030993 RepID=UPI0025572B82|nr:hypothetical protein [Microtetraspora sp. NBRC 16547]
MADRDAGSRGAEDEPRGPEDTAPEGRQEPEPKPVETDAQAEGAKAESGDEPVTAEPVAGGEAGAGTPAASGADAERPTTVNPVPTPPTRPFASPDGSPGPRPGNFGPTPPAYGFGAPTFGPASGSVGPTVSAAFGSAPGSGNYAYGPGGPGWTAPGWRTAPGVGVPGHGSRLPSHAARFGAFARGRGGQLIVAGLIGAIIGGGAVAVGTAIWDRGQVYDATLERGYGDGRNPLDRSFGQRQGPSELQDQLSRYCKRTETGFRCELPRSGGSW